MERERRKTIKDDIIIYEVMAEELERDWWKNFKKKIEHEFEQDEIVIRAIAIELL